MVRAVGQVLFAFGGIFSLAVRQEVRDVEVLDVKALDCFVNECADDLACGILYSALGFRDSV